VVARIPCRIRRTLYLGLILVPLQGNCLGPLSFLILRSPLRRTQYQPRPANPAANCLASNMPHATGASRMRKRFCPEMLH
jgi:hypothetical protein